MVESVPISARELIRHLPDLLAGEEPGLDNPRVTDFLVEHPTARIAVSAASCLSRALREGVSTRRLDRPTRLSMETLAGPLKREMALLSFRAGVAELEVRAKREDLPYRGFAEKLHPESPHRPPSRLELNTLGELLDPATIAPLLAWTESPAISGSLRSAKTLLDHARDGMQTPALDWFATHVDATLTPTRAVDLWHRLAKATPSGSHLARALGMLAWELRERGDTTRCIEIQMQATVENPRDECAWFNAMLDQAFSGTPTQAVRCAQAFISNLPPTRGVVRQFEAQVRANQGAFRNAFAKSPNLQTSLADALDGVLRKTMLELTR